jgi:predicted nucleic acid-binding protein
MNAILLDANFLVAWLDPKDALHDRASEIDIGLGARLERLLVDVAVTEALGVIADDARNRNDQRSSLNFLTSFEHTPLQTE